MEVVCIVNYVDTQIEEVSLTYKLRFIYTLRNITVIITVTQLPYSFLACALYFSQYNYTAIIGEFAHISLLYFSLQKNNKL